MVDLETPTSALAMGGFSPGDTNQDKNELWNGYVWTELNDMNTSRFHGGEGGTSTAGLQFGGQRFGGFRCAR